MGPGNQTAYADQLKRILNSTVLRQSEGLRKLLEYLGREALSGQPRELKEYTVGVEAFGKPCDYDPKLDSSVRVQAGKLRQRLEEYYRGEGAGDPVLVTLPKGRFRLEMQLRAAEPALSGRDTRAERAGARSFWMPWTVAALALLWAIAATGYAARKQSSGESENSPELRALWAPFLEPKQPAIISLGTPLFAKISGDFYRSPMLNSWKTASESAKLQEVQTVLHGRAIPAFPYTGVGEAWGALELLRMFLAHQKDVGLVLNSGLNWENIQSNNVIFLGPPKFNLHESELPGVQDFNIEHGRLENLHPKPGEPSVFTETWLNDEASPREGYALIARLPGLHGHGFVMELASTSTEGTRAAVEFVTRPEYAAKLAARLRQAAGKIPDYFEAVVRAKFRSQTPIEIELVTVHVLAR